MQLDDALFYLGAYGRYQLMIYFAISMFDNLPSIWNMSVMAFLGFEPEHRCKVRLTSSTTITCIKVGCTCTCM